MLRWLSNQEAFSMRHMCEAHTVKLCCLSLCFPSHASPSEAAHESSTRAGALFHLEVAVGGHVLLTPQVEGHEIALALDPGEVVSAKEAHWHSTPPGYLHVWWDPGVINHQDLHGSAQARP